MYKKPLVYIVILNWNGWQDTLICLKSVIRTKARCDYKIILSDNCSTDDSLEKLSYHLESDFSLFNIVYKSDVQSIIEDFDIALVANKTNGGYAYGNNIGINIALEDPECDFVWILNNDTVVHASALNGLLSRFDNNSKTGVCGSVLVDFNRRTIIQSVGGVYNHFKATTKHICSGVCLNEYVDFDKIEQSIDYVVGASMLISRKCLECIGLLSEDYFLYFEELDFSIRLKKGGFGIAVAPDSIVYHKGGASISTVSDLSFKMFNKNRIRVTQKHFPKYEKFVLLFMFFNALSWMVKGHIKRSLYILKLIVSRK